MQKTGRLDYIDVAKGISILLVVMFHTKFNLHLPLLGDALSTVRVPFFLFLAGVFFTAKLDFKAFFTRKFEQLLVPYYVSCFGFFLWLLVTHSDIVNDFAFGTLYATTFAMDLMLACWFLPHLFLLFTVSWCWQRSWLKSWITIPGLSALLLLGIYLSRELWRLKFNLFAQPFVYVGLPFHLELLPITLPYFLGGYLLREQICTMRFRWEIFVPVAAIFLGIGWLYFEKRIDARIDLNQMYLRTSFALVSSMAGIWSLLQLSCLIVKVKWLRESLLFFGRNSLFILIFHVPVNAVTKYYLPHLAKAQDIFMVSFFFFVLAAVVPVLIKLSFAKVPFLQRFYRITSD